MSLAEYKKKRNFRKTPEPSGQKRGKSKKLIFVVQEHSATRLHYDFRLEMEGTLKSWAVPKGPSLNPADKRLAMMVEDHPFDYKDFEGTIPEGSYGAGNVIVWDNGTYEALDEKGNPVNDEKRLLEGLRKGDLKFFLHGKKLQGRFGLVHMKSSEDNAWLLLKKKDEFASNNDILKKDKSVISGKKLEMRKKKSESRRPVIVTGNSHSNKENYSLEKMPAFVRPMLAEIGDKPFDSPDWIFEMKYDGYRALAAIDKKQNVELYSRNLLSFNKAYSPIVTELEKIKHEALLDGEVVVEDAKGRSQFQLLQNYGVNGGTLKYYVYDLLFLDGNDLTELTLLQRKDILQTLLGKYKLKNIIFSDHIEEKGIEFYKMAEKHHAEGIIGKLSASEYLLGKRSSKWLKIKIAHQQEAIICGITEPKGSRKHFGSLVLGVYEDGTLQYIGNCGTGFNAIALQELYDRFKRYFIDDSPFDEKIKGLGAVQWMEPKLVCEVKYSEWTSEGIMRQPVFLGIRRDKDPAEIVREIPGGQKPRTKQQKKSSHSANGHLKSTSVPSKKKNVSNENDYELEIESKILKLTNQNKIYFPESGITKGALVEYYDEIAPLMLPYIKDRPQSLNRFPNGITGGSFFQKNQDVSKLPSWIQTETIYSESNKADIEYMICNDRATLVFMANLGCIEINPWNSRVGQLEDPDWLVIDLDPEDIGFEEVVKAAQVTHDVFEEMGVDCYCKTSGATGLHIYIPTAAKYNYEVVRNFGQLVAQLVHDRLPDTTSIVRMPAKRQKKVYLDFLQNRKGQTLAAPYSVRPKPGAPVSTPLHWDEVNKKLHPSQFTIKTIFKRIEKEGDLWKPVIGKGVNLEKILKNFMTS